MATWLKIRLKPTISNITYWLMIYCILNFTVFPFIPVYFTNQNTREAYCLVIYFLFVLTSIFQLLKAITNLGIFWKLILFISALSGLLMLFFFYVFASSMAVWTDAGTLYTQKNNPKVRIIRRYVDMGAWGGGTSPDDYEIVLHRPLTSVFKIESHIDTLNIDKSVWIKNK
jgi:hypothetical protein